MSIVAEHYNKQNPTNLEARSESRIFYLRNFNNWIKSVLINEFIRKIRSEKWNPKIAVLDLGSGKGGDIKKWSKSNVNRVTFADLAEKSIEECKNRYENPRAHFQAEFIHLDATTELIKDKVSSQDNLKHDLVSSQFVIHYSFESFEKADNFLQNVSDSLRPGGYFIGTTTNSYEIVKRLRESKENAFGNELYNIKFYKQNKDEFPLFGDKFDFQLDNVVECPEYLINFDCLTLLAQKHDLKLVLCKTFSEYFEANSSNNEYKNLISIMSALEPFYSKHIDKSCLESNEYEYIKEHLKEETTEKDQLKDDEQFVTMSKSEWEVATLYLVFAFVKVNPNENSESDEDVETNLKRKLSQASQDEQESKHTRLSD